MEVATYETPRAHGRAMGVGRTAFAAQHGPDGSSAKRSTNAAQRHFLDSLHRRALARSARTLGPLADSIRPLPQLAQKRRLRRDHRRLAGEALTCSPKTDPRVMRVFKPGKGKEILDETDKTFAGTDHRQAT